MNFVLINMNKIIIHTCMQAEYMQFYAYNS